MQHGPWEWGGFLAFVAAMLALDLGVFHRRSHEVRPREALAWSTVWVGLAMAFAALVWVRDGADSGMAFLTGYVIEKSLSVDNIFVFVVLFGPLGIPAVHQHRVLFWGILSALVLRGAMIWGGTALLARFHGVVYVFGAFLVLTGAKLLLGTGEEAHPEQSRVFRAVRRVLPSTSRFDGARFITREGGRRVATPLLVALVLIEISDVIFAVDSIPAIFAVTTDPYLVFTSNIFAILGLRSLYFLLAGAVARFTYLRPSLAAVLMFVGVKMIAAPWVHIPPAVSLGVVTGILAAGVAASLWKNRRRARPADPGLGHRPEGA
ncbi:MAG TPA: TerC family protein [Anaeromyxobacteraceae bacterium]|nr:TerC family protein [Anaeromyxobacteraceae bacterium]